MKQFRCIATVLLFVAGCTNLMADVIPYNKARDIASGFFCEPNCQDGNASGMRKACYSGELQPYYVFNNSIGTRWVVVAGDSRMREVLAYGDGTFDENNMPDAAKELFDAYEHLYRMLQNNSKAVNVEIWSNGRAKYLPTPEWDQYNYLTPIHKGYHTPTGCTATAMGEIMRYYCWPEHGYGSYSYVSYTNKFELSADFERPYYLETIPATKVDHEGWSQEIMDRYCLFLYHCGIAIDSDYGGPGGTGSYLGAVSWGLLRNFGYVPSYLQLKEYMNEQYSWPEIIASEIDADRPVAMSASNGYGGHSFVCDGYDENGLFHFNFGWNGISNGYYSIDDVNGYNVLPDILHHIRPNYLKGQEDEPHFELGIDYRFPVEKQGLRPEVIWPIEKGVCFYVRAYTLRNYNEFEGLLGLMLCDKDGNIKQLVGTYATPYLGQASGYDRLPISGVIPEDCDVAPTDRIELYSSSDNGQTWKKVNALMPGTDHIDVNMPSEPFSVTVTAEDGINVDYELTSPYVETMFTAQSAELNGGVIRCVTDENFCITPNIGDGYVFEVIPAKLGLPLSLKFDMGSHLEFPRWYTAPTLTIDKDLVPGTSTTLHVAHYPIYRYLEYGDDRCFNCLIGVGLFDMDGNLLKTLWTKQFDRNYRDWDWDIDITIPDDMPSEFCLAMMTSHDDGKHWWEIYQNWDKTYMRILSGHNHSNNIYKINYYIDDEYGYSKEYKYGATVDAHLTPTRPNKVFSGWQGVPERMPNHDVRVDGYFTPIGEEPVVIESNYAASEQQDERVYDITGRCVANDINDTKALKSGIYIYKGKKIWINPANR